MESTAITNIPILCGAGLAFALGGAIAGSALGSAAISNRSAGGSLYQSHETADMEPRDARALPDHYPLVTRSGVVPVAQLSDRGLFSQRRYRPVIAFAGYIDGGSADPGPGFESDDQQPVSDPSVAANDLPSSPLDVTHDESGAKIIDVQATFAMR